MQAPGLCLPPNLDSVDVDQESALYKLSSASDVPPNLTQDMLRRDHLVKKGIQDLLRKETV